MQLLLASLIHLELSRGAPDTSGWRGCGLQYMPTRHTSQHESRGSGRDIGPGCTFLRPQGLTSSRLWRRLKGIFCHWLSSGGFPESALGLSGSSQNPAGGRFVFSTDFEEPYSNKGYLSASNPSVLSGERRLRGADMANVRTMDDMRREEATRSGVRPTPNPWAGGSQPQGNFTPAGGYTPIPDQQSMGGVGAGDVYIDACGETIPVSSLSPWQLPMAMCCPCCIGDPCSENRRNWYVNQMKTFIGIISILQVIIFFIEVQLSGWTGILDVPSDVLYLMGGKVASNIAAGEYWRLITPIMLHAGLFHLLINVFTQCMFGIQLEREWGADKIAIIYGVSGVYGNVLSVLFAPNALSIGCSGSVFGLFGAQVAYIVGMWRLLGDLQKKMLLLSLLLSFAFIFAFSFGVGVDMSAHLGGFLSGMVLGLGFFSNKWDQNNWWAKYGAYIAFSITGATILVACIFFWHNPDLGYEEWKAPTTPVH